MSTVSRKAQQSIDTRERLIQAAGQLFAERGYANSSVASIGAAANVSRGLISHHFGSKENLLWAVIADVLDEWENQVMRPAVAHKRGVYRLQAILESFKSFVRERPDRARLMFRLMFEALDADHDLVAEMAMVQKRWIEQSKQWWEEGLADGQIDPSRDHDATATMLIGSARGIALDWLISPENVNLDGAYDQLWLSFQRGLAPD